MDPQHRVGTREEWLAASKALLVEEKAYTRAGDELARKRRALPWVKVDKTYVFETPQGRKTLADLFDGRSQLIIYHFMMGPDWEEGCVGCSFLSDHMSGIVTHLEHHDVSYVTVSHAPLAKIEAFRKRMGWGFPWVSSSGSDFNFDYHVSFTPEELASKKGVLQLHRAGCRHRRAITATACSTRTATATCSTRIRAMDAATNGSSTRTRIWTSRRKAATRRGIWVIGSNITIGTKRRRMVETRAARDGDVRGGRQHRPHSRRKSRFDAAARACCGGYWLLTADFQRRDKT